MKNKERRMGNILNGEKFVIIFMNIHTFVTRSIVHQIVVKFHDKNNAVVVSMSEITCHVGYTIAFLI